jgi:hypothetical protein
MSEWDETRERLHEQADREYGQAWIPRAAGDELLGRVTEVRPVVHTAYGPAPVVEIEDPVHAAWSVWLVHTVLRREFERQQPKVGERILIRYLGAVRPEGGAPYESYRLIVDRVDENNDIDWRAIAERYGDAVETTDRPDEQAARGEDVAF